MSCKPQSVHSILDDRIVIGTLAATYYDLPVLRCPPAISFSTRDWFAHSVFVFWCSIQLDGAVVEPTCFPSRLVFDLFGGAYLA